MTTLGVIATLVLGSSALAEPGYRIAVPPGER